ncbi:MAG TPA: DNA polymerase III subunit delta [Pseudomonadaceae bacterium]|nr:DNA polymerase III subunit delta [Pseudomonadaceae bacterium]
MQIKAELLAASLRKNSLPLVWISGDEPLLVQEACDTVRQFAREQDFTEREVLDAGKGFDWTRLLAAGNSLSLFAERKLVDLRLAGPKLEEDGRNALMRYLEAPNPDNLLLLTTGKVEKASQSTKWFKALEAHALFCQIWPVTEQELPRWIGQRLHKLGMQADEEVLQLLADKVEGNLLAANQEVQKLRILSPGDKLDAAMVLEAVSDSSRFNGFALTEACLSGNTERALKVLQHLEAEGGEVLAILGVLCSQIRALAAMQDDLASGQNINAVLQNHRVWNKRSQMVRRSLQEHNSASLQALLARARRVDQSAKRLLDLRPWDELADLVLKFSDPRMLAGVI